LPGAATSSSALIMRGIEGDKIVVWNGMVQTPCMYVMGGPIYPDGANLYNKEGLPASPFRTDQ
jgi:sialate O-acetylesterase